MRTGLHIHYVRRQDIDTNRWDTCVENAANTILYGYHFYLDHMAAGQWDALILGDYEAIMPLTWRRKYGIRYLYQPPFTQQTGIFSAKPQSPETIEAFLQTARGHFRFAEIFLNYGNDHPSLQPYTNYILSLDAPYEQLASRYRKDLVNNLKLAGRSGFHYTRDLDLKTTLEGYRHEYAARTPHVTSADYRHFERLCHYLQFREQLILRAVTTTDGQTLATALLLRDKQRLYLLQSTTPETGRKTGANHFLLDALIREFAGEPLLLDFEGSDLPGVAHFYKNFGGIDQPYYFYRYNRLPFFVNLFKWIKSYRLSSPFITKRPASSPSSTTGETC